MNLLRRKLQFFLTVKKSPKYTPIEYIESTGTQYIDTLLPRIEGITIETDIQFIASNNRQLQGWAGDNANYWESTTSELYSLGSSYTISDKSTTERNIVIFKPAFINNTSATLTVDGSSVSRPRNGSTFIDTTYTLFNVRRTSTTMADYWNTAKLYHFTAKDSSDKLIKDMIPVLDENGIACLFDRVENKFYYNQGTGEFIDGPQIIQVEYLESTGTQYIDTNHYGTNNTEVIIDMRAKSSSQQRIGGCFVSSVAKNNLSMLANSGTSRFDGVVVSSSTLSPKTTRVKYKINNTGYYIDDVNVCSFSNVSEFVTPDTLFVGMNRGFTSGGLAGNIYQAIIKENNILIHDFIPAVINNIPCLFDTVNWKAHYNAGTGSFTYG